MYNLLLNALESVLSGMLKNKTLNHHTALVGNNLEARFLTYCLCSPCCGRDPSKALPEFLVWPLGPISVDCCVCVLGHIQLLVTPWTVTR